VPAGSKPGPQATSRTVDIGGPVHVLDFGGPAGAPVLVCVHGLGGSHVNWLAIGPPLARDHRVLAIDLPGHGLTPPAGRPATVRANQRLLDRFLHQVVGGPAILVGNSMGGTIALLQATAAPDTVAGAVLVDPALPLPGLARPDRLVARQFLLYAIPVVGERYLAWERRGAAEELVRRVLALCCVDPERVPAEVVEASVELARRRKGQQGLERAFLEAARSLLWLLGRRAQARAMLAAVTAPVLLLHGDADRLVPLAAARTAAAANPSWRFEVAADTGHVPMLERPEWTVAVIRDWLSREGAAAARAARPAAT
jgi:pimeloyl-ACP methyl ester carboxylesterase